MDTLLLDIHRASRHADGVLHFNVRYLPNPYLNVLMKGRVYSDSQPVPAPAFNITFNIQNHSFSGIKVDQLKVQGDVMYKPFKGVRIIGRAGKIEVRW